MPLSAYQKPVSSKPTVDFLEALAQDEASATVNLRLPLRDPLWFIRAISIIAVQNLAWELQLFNSAINMGLTMASDGFVSVWQFGVIPAQGPGYPFTLESGDPANAFFHQYIDGNMMPYWDLDQLNAVNAVANQPLGTGVANASPNNAELHVRLINRSVTAKLADADGAVKVTFYCANQGMQA